MKHKKGFAAVLLTLIISALLSVSAFAASDGFSDVPEASPFYESVTYLAGRGITCGTGNGRYAPDTPITVRQWATMICRAFDKEDALSDPAGYGGDACINQGYADGWLNLPAMAAPDSRLCRYAIYESGFAAFDIALYEGDLISNANLFISQYCAAKNLDFAAISLTDMEQILRAGLTHLYSFSRTMEVRTVPAEEDGEEDTAETWYIYTIRYNGEAYFADSIFALTDEQKGLAENYTENLSLFLGDGLFQYAPSTNTITALGDVRFTDGETEVIYFNQLDERYANQPYGTDHIGGYGCGPTSMAIVVSSLTSETVDPVQMARWAYEHGYWCSKSGSYHTLIPSAAQAWGLSVEGCTASEPQRILDALADGKLVVALMTKGHFTKSGHFIVLRGVQDEKILVADPASYRRSQKVWDLSIILNEASRRAGAGGPFWIMG